MRFLPLYSPEADALGAELAPALVVNRKNLVEGVPSVEEIKELVENSRSRLGVLLMKAPGGEEAENALTLALEALDQGNRADIFCLSDGVWLTKQGPKGPLEKRLPQFMGRGGKVWASGEHLKAAGLTKERLVPQVEVADDALGDLVDMIMDQWDKVVVL